MDIALHEPPPARTLGGRYRVVRVLKRGQGIETLLARDLAGERDVVVKTVTAEALPPGARQRLEHEAAVLREVGGPGLRPLLDLGEAGGLLFIVMPFVEGVGLDARLAGAPLPARDALTVGRCLFGALKEAHAHGVLHRDVKPANVIVDAAAPLTRASLIDFGLARSWRLDGSIRELPVGTARYVAPEQAGLLRHGVDERSDLYATGATLYECLTGQPAFEGADLGEVLRRHLGPRPPDSRSLGFATPRALDEVVARLLRIDPRERYQSAEAALVDLDEIARALDRGVAEPEIVVGARDRRRSALTEPAFVGRGEELAALDAAVARSRAGRGGLVLLEAPSGGGKTRLLDELAKRSAGQGGSWVLRSAGVDRMAPRPFEVLESVVSELCAAARTEPGLGDAIRGRLDFHREAAVAAFPELAPLVGSTAAAGGSLGLEAHGEVRTVRALAALLDALGSAKRPALCLLDDGQWADELTLKLLGEWQRGDGGDAGARPERHVTLVVSFRSDEVPPGHPLRMLGPAARRIAVRPFAPEETRRLVESMAGELPEEALGTVERLAEGNPFLATAVLQGMVETGALAGEADGWRVDPAAMAEVQLSRRAAALVTRRLERLPEAVRRLLSVGALLGKEFDVDLAADLAGGTAREGGAALAEARRRQIVWTDAGGARCAFVHDRLREALLAGLGEEERRRLHRLAAERTLGRDRGRVFEIAHHFDGAGDPERALPYALAAAEQARSRYALEVAERFYRIAERGADRAEAATRLRVLEGLADVLSFRGRYGEAVRPYEAARSLCQDRIAEARIDGQIGYLEQRRGNGGASLAAMERALRALGQPVPGGRLRFVFQLLFEVLVQVLHMLLPRMFLGRRPLEGAEAERLAIRQYNRLSLTYILNRGTPWGVWAHLRELNLAERFPPTPELGRAYAEHGWVSAQVFPNAERGRAYAARGAAICRTHGDVWGHAHALTCLGFASYACQRFAEALEILAGAVREMERIGDSWELASALYFEVCCHYRMGQVPLGLELTRRMQRNGTTLGSDEGAASFLWAWAKLSGGRVPAAEIEIVRKRRNDNVATIQALRQAEADCLLAAGRPAEAVAALEGADRVIRENHLRLDMVTPVPISLAGALREAAAKTLREDGRAREALLGRASRVARRGLRLARTFRNNLPHALRESGLVAAARGRLGRARKLLDESFAVADRHGQRWERAKTLLARGELGRPLGWPGAEADLAEAWKELRAIGAPEVERLEGGAGAGIGREPAVTLSLADRFAAVLEVGRKIASSVTREAVFAAVREAAVSLLRAERCAVVEIGAGGAGSGAAADGVSRTALEGALASGHPAVYADGAAGEAGDSVVLAGVRSSVCAPILVRGQPAACLYATHREVGGLFGDEEARLAEFIAAIAGAALENADGFAANRRAEGEIRRLGEALVRGQEDERRRLALALHDGAGQLLAALDLRLGELSRRTGNAPVPAETVESMQALVSGLTEETRRIAHDLRPAALDRLGLAEALDDLAESVSTGALAVAVEVDPPGGVAPPLPVSVGLFRIAQAALANVARHARAGRAWIRLRAAEGRVRLEVEDDGAGFDPDASAPRAGIGLIGMRERAAWLGGRFEIDAAPGRGTRVRVEVPLAGGGP